MVDRDMKTQWHFRGTSIRGASHIRKEIVNQDAISSESGQGFPLILAIADGHGSAKSFRSHLGSQLAVETATEEFKGFYQKCQFNSQELDFILDSITTDLSKHLVNKWRQKVDEHINENTFREEEWTKLIAKDGETAKQAVEKNPYLAYGATLLTVLVTESFIVYFQLGDGDIICVDSQGNTTRPIPPDKRLIANETTSLCRETAWKDVRLKVQDLSLDSLSKSPEIILVSTDGYANSFSSESDFLQVGKDYLQMIREQGLDKVAEDLPEFLNYSSENGSGDDITLGIIKRIFPKDKKFISEVSKNPLEEEKKIEEDMSIKEKVTNDIEPQLQQIISQQKEIIQENKLLKTLLFSLVVLGALGILANIRFLFFLNSANSTVSKTEPSPSSELIELNKNIQDINKSLEQISEIKKTIYYMSPKIELLYDERNQINKLNESLRELTEKIDIYNPEYRKNSSEKKDTRKEES